MYQRACEQSKLYSNNFSISANRVTNSKQRTDSQDRSLADRLFYPCFIAVSYRAQVVWDERSECILMCRYVCHDLAVVTPPKLDLTSGKF